LLICLKHNFIKMNKKFTEIYNSIDIDMTSAVSDYKDPFHLLSLANLSDESPHIRTVVLRDFSMSKNIF
jgi:pyridoxamine 5'-phosphate oxidase